MVVDNNPAAAFDDDKVVEEEGFKLEETDDACSSINGKVIGYS